MTVKPAWMLGPMAQAIDPDVSKRIDALRTILISLIVIGHGGKSLTVLFPQMGTVTDYVFKVVNLYVDLTTVPLFFCISGYLFLRKADLSWSAYKKMCQAKFFSVFVPFFFFNIIWVLWFYFVGSIDMFGSWASVVEGGVVDKLFGLTGLPVNYPLWFLRDLIYMFLVFPIFLLLYKEAPGVGLVVLFIVWVVSTAGMTYSLFCHAFAFYLGGYLSRTGFDLRDSARWDNPAAAVFIAATLVLPLGAGGLLRPDVFSFLSKVYMILGVAFFWRLSRFEAIKNMRLLHKMAGYSFFIYLGHEPTVSILQSHLLRFWKPVSDPDQLLYYLGSGLATIFFLYGLGLVLGRLAPRLFGFLTGARRVRRPLAQG